MDLNQLCNKAGTVFASQDNGVAETLRTSAGHGSFCSGLGRWRLSSSEKGGSDGLIFSSVVVTRGNPDSPALTVLERYVEVGTKKVNPCFLRYLREQIPTVRSLPD